MTWLLAVLAVWAVLTTVAMFGLAKALRARAQTREEAWDNGCQHGLRLAHHTIATAPKPWITLSEEQGWEMAREQVRVAVAALIEEDS